MLNHIGTQWQVTLDTDPTFASPVIDELSFVFLLAFTATGLLPSTNYLVRANYLFDDASFSGFGAAVPFTTLAANTIQEPGSFQFATQGCGDCD